MRIILLEDLEAKPRATLSGLFDFLGVDPGFTPDVSKVANPGGAPRIKLLHDLLANKKLIAATRGVMPEALVAPLKALRSRNLRKSALPEADRAAADRLLPRRHPQDPGSDRARPVALAARVTPEAGGRPPARRVRRLLC